MANYTENELAKDLENAGAHMIAIKDMAGLLTPYAATELVGALKDTLSIPLHLHTHDTSSIQSATYLKAIEAGVDVVDVACRARTVRRRRFVQLAHLQHDPRHRTHRSVGRRVARRVGVRNVRGRVGPMDCLRRRQLVDARPVDGMALRGVVGAMD